MNIYIDSDFKCHVADPENIYRCFNVPFFDGKCSTFIEGHRYVPHDESWTRSDDTVFTGEVIFPWKPWDDLDAAQLDYEWELASEYSRAFSEIEALIKPPVARGTMETIVEARKQSILSRFDEMLRTLMDE